MDYKFLTIRGALNEAASVAVAPARPGAVSGLATRDIPPHVLELIPESVARENVLVPLAFDGETITVATANPQDIALADKLRFLLAKNIQLVVAPRREIIACINRNYNQAETESVDSMLSTFTDTAIDFTQTASAGLTPPPRPAAPARAAAGWAGKRRRATSIDLESLAEPSDATPYGSSGMF